MAGMFKGYAQATGSHAAAGAVELSPSKDRANESGGPAGGLLIAVGTSLILWAVIAQAAKLASSLFF